MNKMQQLIVIFLASLLSACTSTGSLTQPQLKSGIDKSGFDLNVRPQDDFYDHVNGTWLKTTEIPSDKSNYSMFGKLADEAEINIRTIIEETSNKNNLGQGTPAQKIRDYYNTYTEFAENPTVNLDGLANELSMIQNIGDHKQLVQVFAELGKIGVSSPLGGYIYSDLKNPDVYEVYLTQSRLLSQG